jgi:hypothetical protein
LQYIQDHGSFEIHAEETMGFRIGGFDIIRAEAYGMGYPTAASFVGGYP